MPPIPQRLNFSAPTSVFPTAWLRYFPGDLARSLPPKSAQTFPLQHLETLADFPDLPSTSSLRPLIWPQTEVGELVPWSVTGYPPTHSSHSANSGNVDNGGSQGHRTLGCLNSPAGYVPLSSQAGTPTPPAAPPAAPPPAPRRAASPYARGTLTLHQYLYSAHVFDVYAAFLGPHPVLVKLTNLATFEPSELSHLLSVIECEIALGHKLGAMNVAPEFMGMYGSLQPDRSQPVMMVYEGARELTKIERHDKRIQGEIVKLYEELHGLGITHGSVGWRYVRMLGDEVVLFDFEHASEREEGWEEKRTKEMEAVKKLIKWK